MILNMRVILLTLGFVLLQLTAVANDQPNVVVFLTDDQGWGDLSIHGNTNLSTPNIDSLAEQGAAFNQFFVCAVCAPTRAEFLTGRYHPRTGVSGVSQGSERLNPDETTIADLFKAAGYATGAFGKWHNGTQAPYHPNYRGFEEYYGFTSGHWGHYFSPPLDHNGKPVRGKGYVVDDFTDHAIRFIQENRDQPFFCYIPYNTPHSPMYVPDRFFDKFDGVDPEMRHRDPKKEDVSWTRAALAMCENIDWNVGRVLKTLDELKLSDNTIVVFFCDNGPNSWRWNGGFKGKKGSIDEGGVRSPLFIRWPGQIPEGSKIKQVSGAIDLLPTLAELTDIPADGGKPIDGISLARELKGHPELKSERAIFSIRAMGGTPTVSIRTNRWRLDNDGHLFDMAKDPGQKTDVAESHKKLASRLLKQANEHKREMVELVEANADRPFTVGYAKHTTLPARDGIEHGNIQRSVRSPNNSFFKNWTSKDDSITWSVDVVNAGTYEAIVYYTCADGDEGAVIRLGMDGGKYAQARVTEAWDPPLYDKSMERVADSHYFMKDWKPLSLGKLKLEKGHGILRLGSRDIKSSRVIDTIGVELIRVD